MSSNHPVIRLLLFGQESASAKMHMAWCFSPKKSCESTFLYTAQQDVYPVEHLTHLSFIKGIPFSIFTSSWSSVKQKRNIECLILLTLYIGMCPSNLRIKQTPQHTTTRALIGCGASLKPGGVACPGSRWSEYAWASRILLLYSDCSGERMANPDSPTTVITQVFRGTLCHSTQQTALQILEDALLGVDAEGKVRHN